MKDLFGDFFVAVTGTVPLVQVYSTGALHRYLADPSVRTSAAPRVSIRPQTEAANDPRLS